MKCEKRSFETKAQAKARVKEIREDSAYRLKKPVRTYRCESCGAWHLTSSVRNDEDWKKIKASKDYQNVKALIEKQLTGPKD